MSVRDWWEAVKELFVEKKRPGRDERIPPRFLPPHSLPDSELPPKWPEKKHRQ